METGAITSHIDVAQVALYAFWIFFAGLLFYLRREDRREGYPLVSEVSGRQEASGPVWMPDPKTFHLADGRTVTVPNSRVDARDLRARASEGWSGSTFLPTGNPMIDGVGPATYAERSNTPDMTFDRRLRIVPMRSDMHYSLATEDPDPRGMLVFGADGKSAGKIVDVWVDRSDFILRYVEVELATDVATPDAAAGHVLLPTHFMDIDRLNNRIIVRAILSEQFATVPRIAQPDRVTLLEEDRIQAYYGSGYLYATPSRQEPLL